MRKKFSVGIGILMLIGLMIPCFAELNTELISIRGETAKAFYAPNETMEFVITVDFGEQDASKDPCLVKWVRTGDDGKRETGEFEVVPGKSNVIKTSLETPGINLVGCLNES